MKQDAVIINTLDNVAVALKPLKKGDSYFGVVLLDDIGEGHKFALSKIDKGSGVIKYGNPIGSAKQDIEAGSFVHTHNLKTNLDGKLEYTFNPSNPKIRAAVDQEIEIYRRKNNQVGIRNELWIVPTVGCVNSEARLLAKRFLESHKHLEVDAVFAFNHPYGCSQMGDDHQRTLKILQNIVLHPNAGGVLVLGLGCENNQIDTFKATLEGYDSQRVLFLNAQSVSDEIESGLVLLEELYALAKCDKRTKGKLSELKIGLKCGGSDGLSGITANPLLGLLTDHLTALNGTVALTEVPEMFGAETLLMERCAERAVFDKTVQMVNGFKDYYARHNQVIYENPSPGNKSGGITTLEEKSLGCVQKGGAATVTDVIFDGELIKKRGLNLINGPGNDIVAVTNLGAAGCHMVLFTTGRGTPLGGFVPTVKVSTNDRLFYHKRAWIDFNAAGLLEKDKDEILQEFIDYIVCVASGKFTQNELNEAKEIAIFKSGVTL